MFSVYEDKGELERILLEIKVKAEKTFVQVSNRNFFRKLDPDSNSVAIILQHLMESNVFRCDYLLAPNGQKPLRNRDAGFDVPPGRQKVVRESLMKTWDRAWGKLFETLKSLTADDFSSKKFKFGDKEYSTSGALELLYRHIVEHVGQFILLAKHFAGKRWKTVSVPKTKKK